MRHHYWIPMLFVGLFAIILVYRIFSKQQVFLLMDKDHVNNSYAMYVAPKYAGNDSYTNSINLKQDCGELCDTSRPGVAGPFFDHITADINCQALFANPFVDKGHAKPQAPREIPKEMLMYYTMNGRLKISPMYFDQPFLGGKALKPVWEKEDIENQITLARQGKLEGSYGVSETNALRDGLVHAPHIKNGRILVIGSHRPWVEACALEAGAREVVTLEYGKIRSKHPKVKTILPHDFRQRYLNGTLGSFDGIITFSSVEHSGLGRYGDALNPWGDIIAIARGWCVTKVNGSLTIGVMYDNNKDYIKFNAHRVYGKIRYPYLTTNWHQHYQGHGHQRVYVFTKYDTIP